jgi:hypothetical protein
VAPISATLRAQAPRLELTSTQLRTQLPMLEKAIKLDGATARTHADALEQHILARCAST